MASGRLLHTYLKPKSRYDYTAIVACFFFLQSPRLEITSLRAQRLALIVCRCTGPDDRSWNRCAAELRKAGTYGDVGLSDGVVKYDKAHDEMNAVFCTFIRCCRSYFSGKGSKVSLDRSVVCPGGSRRRTEQTKLLLA